MLSLMVPLLLAVAAPAPAASPAPVARNCLPSRQMTGERLSAEKGYFVRTRQGWWRNTGPMCPFLGPNRLLVAVRPNDDLCSSDLVNVVENYQRINLGVCTLGSWERVEPDSVPRSSGK